MRTGRLLRCRAQTFLLPSDPPQHQRMHTHQTLVMVRSAVGATGGRRGSIHVHPILSVLLKVTFPRVELGTLVHIHSLTLTFFHRHLLQDDIRPRTNYSHPVASERSVCSRISPCTRRCTCEKKRHATHAHCLLTNGEKRDSSPPQVYWNTILQSNQVYLLFRAGRNY